MARRSARIQELREQNELNCVPGLFSILDSHQGCANPKLISNGRPPNKLLTDYPRKLDQRTSFDEECRKIQYESKLASFTVNASVRSLRDIIREDMYNEKNKNKQIVVKGQQWTKTDNKLVYHLLETQKAARKKRQKDYHSILYHLNNSARQSQERSSSGASNGKRTSFSVGEIKEKLKHTFGGNRKEPNQFSMCGYSSKLSHSRSIFGDDCMYRGVDARTPLSYSTSRKTKEKEGKKRGLKLVRQPDTAWESESVRQKIDFSSGRYSKKHGVDAVLEANKLLSEKLIDSNATSTTRERSPKTLGTIISSPEHGFWLLRPRRDSQYCSYTPLRTNTELVTSCDDDYKEYDETTEILSVESSSSMIPSTDEEAQDTSSIATGNMKPNDELKIRETNNVLHFKVPNDAHRTAKIELYEEDGSVMHSIFDSLSDNETFTNTADEVPSTPTGIHQLDMPESSKYQEEHESPVSVLDQFFAEDINCPSSNMFQTDGDRLKPRRRLRFEECSFESSPKDEQDYVSHYVHLIFQASSLNWDQIAKIRPLSEELLHSSLSDEVGFLLSDSHIDTRLLFDHINEVLSKIQRSVFLSAYAKPRLISCVEQLEEAVVDEIMREADFYLLPRTQKRTLDQLVAKDVADFGLWLDVWPETEHIMRHISEDILEESILDVILEIHC